MTTLLAEGNAVVARCDQCRRVSPAVIDRLEATLRVATGFVAVPAAAATPSVFNDSGSVQVPLFGD